MSHHLYYAAEELIIYNLIPQRDGTVQYEQADVEALEPGEFGCECGEQFENEHEAIEHIQEVTSKP